MSVAKSPFGACQGRVRPKPSEKSPNHHLGRQILAPSMKPLPEERLKNIVALSVIQKAVWSISGFWPKTIVRSAQKHGARPIFGSRPNIWFLKPPESCFQPFLVPDPKLLPEDSKTWRASYFWVWTEYLVFGASRNRFDAIVSWPQTIARTTHNMAGELFLGLDRIFGFS